MKRLIMQTLFGSALVVAIGGCYTQIGTLSYADDSAEKRSVVVQQSDSTADSTLRSRTDTLVIRDERTRNCFWTRNVWGEPHLRCSDESIPFDSWYSYRYTPWWNRSFDSYYSHHGSCPSFYYYDPYTGTCRHRSDYSRCYDCYGWGSRGGTGSIGSGSGSTNGFEPRSRGTVSRPSPASGSSGNAVYREPQGSTESSNTSRPSNTFEQRSRATSPVVEQPRPSSPVPAPIKAVSPSPTLQKAEPGSSDAEDEEEQKRKELQEARQRYLEYRRTKK